MFAKKCSDVPRIKVLFGAGSALVVVPVPDLFSAGSVRVSCVQSTCLVLFCVSYQGRILDFGQGGPM